MAILLGMKELRGIYQRQKGRNAIPTVRVGGIERVYEEDVLETLEHAQDSSTDAVITLYRRVQREQDV
jgi:hypothetical protein